MSAATLPFKQCPAEQGRHSWVFHAAHRCKEIGVDAAAAVVLIEEHLTRPPSPANEIETTVAKVYGGHVSTSPKWPGRDEARIAEFAKAQFGVEALRAASPKQLSGDGPHTEEVIDVLFPSDPLLCCGRASFRFETRTREQWRGELAKQQLIVPSPMSAKTGITQRKTVSAHTLESTGARRFLVVEFDTGTADLHAAVLQHLAEFMPFALAVHSGGKSLHGWFYCAGEDEDRFKQFMSYAVSLGADPVTWTRSQFVRMPDGLRNGKTRQRILYFNAEVVR